MNDEHGIDNIPRNLMWIFWYLEQHDNSLCSTDDRQVECRTMQGYKYSCHTMVIPSLLNSERFRLYCVEKRLLKINILRINIHDLPFEVITTHTLTHIFFLPIVLCKFSERNAISGHTTDDLISLESVVGKDHVHFFLKMYFFNFRNFSFYLEHWYFTKELL